MRSVKYFDSRTSKIPILTLKKISTSPLNQRCQSQQCLLMVGENKQIVFLFVGSHGSFSSFLSKYFVCEQDLVIVFLVLLFSLHKANFTFDNNFSFICLLLHSKHWNGNKPLFLE